MAIEPTPNVTRYDISEMGRLPVPNSARYQNPKCLACGKRFKPGELTVHVARVVSTDATGVILSTNRYDHAHHTCPTPKVRFKNS